jgi:transcriptional regulator with PAS, ATPase and Fis domain
VTGPVAPGEPGETAPERRTADLVVDHQRPHTLIRRFRLVVMSGRDAGRNCLSEGERTVIGKHESADLVLHDGAVSRFHCEIAVSGGRVAVRDLGSRNGTLVNGVEIAQAWLRSGAILTLGQTEVKFDQGADHVVQPLSPRERFGGMVGRSSAMRAVFALLERAAASDATVLLEGETGTGKEAAAESIHLESTRSSGPFVVVDCGAVPPDLLESELFGHERGAFTDAVASRQGAFEAAQGGTIFLDEIGELGSDLQPKLLRALERREIKRVGGSHYSPVDVRVIAATNRNLRVEVNDRRFRSDLFYRLAVLTVRLPPLRDRPEDIDLLVENLLAGLDAATAPAAASLRARPFLDHLARHHWPGNVRELRNYVERCLAMRGQTPLLEDGDEPAPPTLDPRQPIKTARERWVRELERRYVAELLRLHQDNVSAAARAAGVDRPYFYRLLWRHGFR